MSKPETSVPSPVRVLLQPGEYFVGDERHEIRTVLGSCVSITLWHRARHIGAMSHFLLASRGKHLDASDRDGRYGEEALSLMLEGLRSRNVAMHECEGKLFGGGNMFPLISGCHALQSVGQKNGDAARQLLADLSIPLVSESLYGTGHREIVFNVATGDVWVRQVPPAEVKEESLFA